MTDTEKLQKVLARAGLGSRREIEAWIAQGRVKVDGVVAKLGDRVNSSARVTLDDRPVRHERLIPPPAKALVYYKPVGEVCTRSDPQGRPTVFEKLPALRQGRWISVGRLDVNTSGLLLLTTDGDLANRLMHPSGAIAREYAVRVNGDVDEACLRRLTDGVELEDGKAAFDEVVADGGGGANRWFRVTLREGRKREVRRLWESQGVTVSRLVRTRFGPIELPRDMRRGATRRLSPEQVAVLYEAAGLERPRATETVERTPANRRRRPVSNGKGSARPRSRRR